MMAFLLWTCLYSLVLRDVSAFVTRRDWPEIDLKQVKNDTISSPTAEFAPEKLASEKDEGPFVAKSHNDDDSSVSKRYTLRGIWHHFRNSYLERIVAKFSEHHLKLFMILGSIVSLLGFIIATFKGNSPAQVSRVDICRGKFMAGFLITFGIIVPIIPVPMKTYLSIDG